MIANKLVTYSVYGMILLLGFGINLYAEVIPKDAREIEKEMISSEIQKKRTQEKEQKQIEALLKELQEAIKTVKGLKEENAKLKKTNNSSVNSQYLEKTNQQLQEEKKLLEETMRKKETAFYEELGAAYVKAKLYDNAIDTYLKVVKLDPKNPEVNYNLGLLYKHSQSDNKKAEYHFRRYLQLDPKAKNKKEVEYLIKMLHYEPEREFARYY